MRPGNKASADAAQVRREQMIVLHAAGKSYQEIGESFGVTATRVCQLIQHGLDYRDRHHTEGLSNALTIR